MNFLINEAMAGAPATSSSSTTPGFFEPLLLLGFVAMFYFLIWRPQSKRTKAHRELVSSIAKGDEIVSSGGIVGSVVKVSDDFILLKIASGVDIKLQRHAVSATLPKGTLKSLEGG